MGLFARFKGKPDADSADKANSLSNDLGVPTQNANNDHNTQNAEGSYLDIKVIPHADFVEIAIKFETPHFDCCSTVFEVNPSQITTDLLGYLVLFCFAVSLRQRSQRSDNYRIPLRDIGLMGGAVLRFGEVAHYRIPCKGDSKADVKAPMQFPNLLGVAA